MTQETWHPSEVTAADQMGLPWTLLGNSLEPDMFEELPREEIFCLQYKTPRKYFE